MRPRQSTHQFISDFFRTDIMNHVEFLKRMNTFGNDDAYLIAEMCDARDSRSAQDDAMCLRLGRKPYAGAMMGS